jgi:hypothetical protein
MRSDNKFSSAADPRHIPSQLEKDRVAGLGTEVGRPEQVFQTYAELARRHGPCLGVRTPDSLHVAAAILLQEERFWTLMSARQN